MTTIKKVNHFVTFQLHLLNIGLKSQHLTTIGIQRYKAKIEILEELYGLINGKKYGDNVIEIDSENES